MNKIKGGYECIDEVKGGLSKEGISQISMVKGNYMTKYHPKKDIFMRRNHFPC